MISVYVRLDVQDRARNRYRIAVRDAVRRAAEAAAPTRLPHPEREAVQRDLARIESYLAKPEGLPHTPGVALFACESVDLFEVVPLPRVLRTRVLLGNRPRLTEARAALAEFGRIVVALIDRTHARFFEVTALTVNELSGLYLPTTRGGKYHSDRADSPGWGERDYHNRIREERHRHAAAVAHRLGTLAAKPCQGIVIAGPGRSVAEQQRFLPTALAGSVLGTARLNPTAATAADVRRAALAVRATWERSREASVLAQLGEAVGTGWAVTGLRPTLRALNRGQVRILVVPAGRIGQGYRCGLSERLVLTPGDCRGEGDPVLISDLVSEAMDDALLQHSEVEVIDDPRLSQRLEGVAAFLRFR